MTAPERVREPRTAPGPAWRTTLPVRAVWSFYAGPWVVLVVVMAAIGSGLLLRLLIR